MRRSSGHARWRANAALSAVLVLLAVGLAHRASRALLSAQLDLTEERLASPSPVGVAMLRGLEDVLEVRAYFTGEVELAVAQLAKRRLVDQLAEVERLAGGNVRVTYRDPNGGSEARAEAYGLGVEPQAVGARQGTSAISQELFLGLVLRYRGREEVLPFVLPQAFEYAFLSAVRRLEREERPVVGLFTGRGDGATPPAGAGFGPLRTLLGDGREVRELLDLDVSGEVPADVDVVLVVGPEELHPRAVFALDQLVQRGGRLALFVDRTRVDPSTGAVEPVTSGLEALLEHWGAPTSQRVAWDPERCRSLELTERVEVGGAQVGTREVSVAYPPWPVVVPEALNADEVLTARLAGLELFWAHPLLPVEAAPPPEGVERTWLAKTSPQAFAVEPTAAALAPDPATLEARTLALAAQREAAALPLAAVLRGRFPSPFVAGAPAPFDPVAAAVHEDAVAAALEEGREPPEPPPVGTTDEPVRSAAASGLVVVVGDADLLRERYFAPRNRMFAEDLVDWLGLEEDLLALRARRPEERPLRDLLGAARAERGLPALAPGAVVRADDTARLRLEEEAAAAAARRRWAWTAGATGGSALLALVVFLVGRLALGRARPRAGAGAVGATP